MLSTSLEWEYKSTISPFVGRKLLRGWWWRDNSGPLSLFIRHLRSPIFSPTSSQLIAPMLRLFLSTHTRTHVAAIHSYSSSDLKYQFAFLSTSLQAQCISTRRHHITHSRRNLVLFSLAFPCFYWRCDYACGLHKAESQLKTLGFSHSLPHPFFRWIHLLLSSKTERQCKHGKKMKVK